MITEAPPAPSQVKSYWLFLLGAFAVLYSTVFGATASNARLLTDALSIFGLVKYSTPADRQRMVKIGCVALPVAFTTVYLLVGEPVTLVFVGALAQGLMLPFLAFAALYFRARQTHPALLAGKVWTFFLWFATLGMTAVGLYQMVTTTGKILKNVQAG